MSFLLGFLTGAALMAVLVGGGLLYVAHSTYYKVDDQ